MLIRSKFEGYKAGIRLYPGKSSAPAAPDYASAAKETAAGNREAAEYTTKANRINQLTPYGSLTYDYTPQYDASGKETGAGWTQRMNLTPEAQATLNKQMAMSNQYADLAQSGLNAAQGTLSNPNLDFSKLPQLQGIDESRLPQSAINAGTTAQQAIMSRLDPTLQRDEEALRQRLANQGIALGSEAYNREMALQGQRANDLRLQAAAQGISLDQAARQQALGEQNLIYGNTADQRARMLQEQTMQADRPLNLISALRTGSQVQSPTFQPYAQQANVAGPDLLNATNQQYQGQIAATNAENAALGGLMSGLGGIFLGGAKMGLFGNKV
jgi:hypothetical protein